MPAPENRKRWSWQRGFSLGAVFCMLVSACARTAAETTPSFTGISVPSNGAVALGISGPTNVALFLQTTSNLVDWVTLQSLTNASGILSYTDKTATASRRLYRLQTITGTNSIYWTNANQTHGYVVTNLLTSFNSYRTQPGSNSAFEWYCVSQIYADETMVAGGGLGYAAYMNNAYAWMNNLWDNGNPIGGYYSAGNVDGTGQGGGKYVDDNSLAGNVYLDCYAVTTGATRTNYLNSARAIANWLMFSGMWDSTYNGGFWWSDSKTVKPTQSNGLAMQLFIRLYGITGETYYKDWANSIRSWLETQMLDSSDGLYIWQIETNGVKNFIKFTYDNAIMIEADLLYAQTMGDTNYTAKAESLARSLNTRLWSVPYKAYYFNTSDGRVNPCWCGWASQSLIRLYQADRNSTWLNYAQQNIDFMNAHLRNRTNFSYYTFCNMDGSSIENRIEGVDQAWMQRIQGMMAAYR
jgi:Glycosyl hydrolase family 76